MNYSAISSASSFLEFTDALNLFFRGYARMIYLVWLILWAQVLYIYSRNMASTHSFSLAKPYKYVASWSELLLWSAKSLTKKENPPKNVLIQGVTNSNILRLGIIYSSMGSVILGFLYWNANKDMYPNVLLIVNIFAVWLSSQGALVHLSIPYDSSSKLWRIQHLLLFSLPIVAGLFSIYFGYPLPSL